MAASTSQKVPDGHRRLPGSERKPGASARLIRAADDTAKLSATIVLRRRPDGPSIPDTAHYAATAPSQRSRLSHDDFAKRYGADDADIAKVEAFAQSYGLTVVDVNAARRTVVVTGTVAQFNEAFGVSLNYYEHKVARGRLQEEHTETYRGRDGSIHVPADLVDVIVAVLGLDDRRITKRNAGDPPGTGRMTIPDMTRLYQFPTNPATGQTIAILSEAGYLPSDISANFAGHPPVITDVAVGASNDNTPDSETTQDIFIAASAAPGAEIAVYFTSYTQQGWFDLISRVVHPGSGDPTCSVLSSSFYVTNGDDEATLAAEGVSTSWLTAVTQAFQDAAIQGVTICIASGDSGADSKVGDGKAHVQYPASDPWVLSVGGTTVGDVNGASFEEYAWNDEFSFGGSPVVKGATGGGVSAYFDPPSYQAGADVPPSLADGRHGRGVPDVSANASPNSGYPMILGGAPSDWPANGTSSSAPLWAGLIAVLNSALQHNVGFINPTLYQLGTNVFRDIVAQPGAADNSLNGVTGYPVRPGWDACTGWGSPNGTALLQALRGAGDGAAG